MLPPSFPPWLALLAAILLVTGAPAATQAQCITNEITLIDLSTWSVIQYGEFGQPNASWLLSESNTVVIQTVNADGSIYLSPFDVQSDRIQGSWRVDTSFDDDFMGFVFGFQDTEHFYLFDWKQLNQNLTTGVFAEQGMTVKAFHADSPLTARDFYATQSLDTNRVRTLYHNTIPWKDFTNYEFLLEFFPGHFVITVTQGTNVLDTITINDSTYTTGKFGFYNYSQDQVRYAGFTRQQLGPRPLISAVGDSVLEGPLATSTNLFFSVNLSITNCEPTLVDYVITPGTAADGQDFSAPAASGTLVFAPGETNKLIPVTIFGDKLEEPDETILLTLSNAVSGIITVPQVVGTIINDDTNLLPAVTLTKPAPQDCLLLPANLLLAAEASDRDGQVVRVQFYDGTNFLGQDTDSPFQFNWSQISPGQHLLYAVAWDDFGGNATSAPVAITASYPSGLSINNQTITEGNTSAIFTVSLTSPSCRTVIVAVATSNGTATANSDYTPVNSTITFLPGETSKTILVPILQDTLIEPDETFFICLSNPTGGVISNACGLGLILNDDTNMPPVVTIVDPPDNSSFATPPGIISIRADAFDSDGSVQQVDFFAGVNLIGSSTGTPFLIQWTNTVIGAYTLTAVATDNAGARGTSAPVHITIRTCNPSLTVGALASQTRCVCDEVTFSAAVESPEPFSCIWKLNGSVLPGQTNTTLLLQNLKPQHAGTYTIEVTTPCATIARSASLTLQGAGNQNPVAFSNASRITITDNNSASPYPSPIEVACLPGLIKHLMVTLDGVTHNFPDDIDVLLTGPGGQAIKLLSDAGGGNKLTNVVISFSDTATAFPSDTQRIQPGVYQPVDYAPADTFLSPAPGTISGTNFTPFLGANPNGTWFLYVRDDLGGDAGSIVRGWSIEIEWEDVAPRLSAPVLGSNDHFQMTLHGLPRMAHAVEVSTDLTTWTPAVTVTPAAPSTLVTLPRPPAGNALFYRAARCP